MSSENRLFELRTYTPVEGKRDALLERLRDTSSRLFAKHGMTNVGYWVEQDDEGKPTENLIYIVSHASREAATKSWEQFWADPDWLSSRGEPVTAGVISQFLTPTAFSALR